MNKEIAAQRIRERLERRIATALNCEPPMPHMKIGTLVHFPFMLDGNSETLGGFNTTIRAVLDVLGFKAFGKSSRNQDQNRRK